MRSMNKKMMEIEKLIYSCDGFKDFNRKIGGIVPPKYIGDNWLEHLANTGDFRKVALSMVLSLRQTKVDRFKHEIYIKYYDKSLPTSTLTIPEEVLFSNGFIESPHELKEKIYKAHTDGVFLGTSFDGDTIEDTMELITRFLDGENVKADIRFYLIRLEDLKEQSDNACRLARVFISKGDKVLDGIELKIESLDKVAVVFKDLDTSVVFNKFKLNGKDVSVVEVEENIKKAAIHNNNNMIELIDDIEKDGGYKSDYPDEYRKLLININEEIVKIRFDVNRLGENYKRSLGLILDIIK